MIATRVIRGSIKIMRILTNIAVFVQVLLLSAAIVAAPVVVVAQGVDDPIFAGDDSDGDTLTDLFETHVGLHPWSMDTDGDGLSDGDEIRTWGTDPGNPDTDGDGSYDNVELSVGTNAQDPDSGAATSAALGTGGGTAEEEGGEGEGCSLLSLDLCFPRWHEAWRDCTISGMPANLRR